MFYSVHVLCGSAINAHGVYNFYKLTDLCFSTFFFLKKIAEQDGGKYEAAVYAAQCSNLIRMLPICTDWEVFSSPLIISQDLLLNAFMFTHF